MEPAAQQLPANAGNVNVEFWHNLVLHNHIELSNVRQAAQPPSSPRSHPGVDLDSDDSYHTIALMGPRQEGQLHSFMPRVHSRMSQERGACSNGVNSCAT